MSKLLGERDEQEAFAAGYRCAQKAIGSHIYGLGNHPCDKSFNEGYQRGMDDLRKGIKV